MESPGSLLLFIPLILFLLLIITSVQSGRSYQRDDLLICMSIGISLLIGVILQNSSSLFLLGLLWYGVGYLLIGIILIKKYRENKTIKPDTRYDSRIPDLEQLIQEKTDALEMTTQLLKNEMEVRSLFETDLQESEQKFHTIADITPLGMMLIDEIGTITYMNAQISRIIGYTPEELPDINTVVTNLIPDLNTQREFLTWLKTQSESQEDNPGESEPAIFYLQAKNGSERIIEFYFAPYGDVQLVLLNDVTARKKAEDALHESDRRYREMIKKIPLIAIILDKEGRVVFGNDYLLDLLGITQEEILGVDWFDSFTLPEDEVKKAVLGDITENNVPYQVENAIYTKKHEVHSILWTNLILQDGEGSATGLVSLGTDITDRILRERAIQLANKKLNILSSISRHDIANELTELFLNLVLVLDDIKEPAIRELITQALDSVRMIRVQIDFTRFYQDLGVHAPAWYPLDGVISKAMSEIPTSHITFTIMTEHISVYADPLIQKVFFNLIDNAIRHGKGVTQISFTLKAQGPELLVRYRDNGIGVSIGEKEKIFDRGFGKNTGMGLFLIREILTITGIAIQEVGEYGKGAEFILTIPKGNWRKDSELSEHEINSGD